MPRGCGYHCRAVFYLNTERMKFLEKDLEEIIFTADKNNLRKKGLSIHGVMKRQLRIGNYGIADLVSFEKPIKPYNQPFDDLSRGLITVYELKQDKIGISAFLQALGYVKGIRRYLENRGFCLYDYDFRIVLIGSSIDDKSTFPYLIDFMCTDYGDHGRDSLLSLECYTYSYDIDGISFKNEYGYKLINEGF